MGLKRCIAMIIILMLTGCGAVQQYRTTQILNDEQKLTRMYTRCIEEHYGDPDAIKQYCEPIVAPLRVRGMETCERIGGGCGQK